MKRYFIVSFVAKQGYNTITGNLDVTTNGHFLNKKLLIENIKESQEGVISCVITNIVELSEKDFSDWTNENP